MRVSFVCFSKNDCPPCVAMRGLIEDVLAKMEIKPEIKYRLLTSEDFKTADISNYGSVRLVPTLHAIVDGVLVSRIVGMMTKSGPLDSKKLNLWFEKMISTYGNYPE
jgi:hypothetical protein